ncbi:MAG: DUF1549 domain-containing protein [Planctomycetota bacterium]|nr:MAG: DUF1549 domain-containing protein [Planctomycetota bacterium]
MVEPRLLPQSTLLVLASSLFLIVSGLPAGLPGQAEASPPLRVPVEPIDFDHEIRPILSAKCQKCHGPNRQEGGLRLDTEAAMRAGGESGSLLPSQASPDGLLLEAVRRESLEMPPDEPLADEEIAALAKWIERGAPWPEHGASVRVDPHFTDEDRQFWSLRPVQDPEVPLDETDGWARGSIDRFVWRNMQADDQQPAAEANRYALLRRLCLDLTGLPPTREQIDAFVADRRPDAYERLVDRLLASPHYGERWAQHWLDLVRYADSNGFKTDEPRPHAWRYREYVVNALNEDRPYDQFITEQIAGDEIAPDDPQVLVATGYLYCGIYESNQANIWTQRLELLNDITDVTGDVFLGLSMSCARCHDHKFDPILQKDYYRLQAYFTPLLMRDATEMPNVEQLAKQAAWEQETQRIRRQMAQMERPHMQAIRKSRAARFDKSLREVMAREPSARSMLERQVMVLIDRQIYREQINLPAQMKGEEKDRWLALQQELARHDDMRPTNIPHGHVAQDVGAVAPATYIPGDQSGEDILPGPLSILDSEPAVVETPASAPNSTGRRTALARWLTSPENPLTARVIVNRLWQHHFGEGLVTTPSNFGTTGAAPRDAELLDYLARQLVADDWRLKSLHRRIVTSATYRQVNDGSNETPWRFRPRRLDGEQLRDTILAICGKLDRRVGGPPVDHDAWRRSLYLRRNRNAPHTWFSAFDVPDRVLSVAQRDVTTTPLQAILVLSDPWYTELVASLADEYRPRAEADLPGTIEELWLRIVNRPPTEREQQICRELLRELEAAQVEDKEQDRWSYLVWALFTMDEVIFLR